MIIDFPTWVKSTHCLYRTYTVLVPGRHGMNRYQLRVRNIHPKYRTEETIRKAFDGLL